VVALPPPPEKLMGTPSIPSPVFASVMRPAITRGGSQTKSWLAGGVVTLFRERDAGENEPLPCEGVRLPLHPWTTFRLKKPPPAVVALPPPLEKLTLTPSTPAPVS